MNKDDLAQCVVILEGVISSLRLVIDIFKEKGLMLEKEKPRLFRPIYFCKKCARVLLTHAHSRRSMGKYELIHLRQKTFSDKIFHEYECPSCHYVLVTEEPKEK
jgi:hypothetical protein